MTRFANRNELRRRSQRQGPQQQSVDEGEDGGVRADRKTQAQYDKTGERAIRGERAQRRHLRLIIRHAACPIQLGQTVEVIAQFLVELSFELAASHDGPSLWHSPSTRDQSQCAMLLKVMGTRIHSQGGARPARGASLGRPGESGTLPWRHAYAGLPSRWR